MAVESYPDCRSATADELAAEISIMLSADKRRAPILRGKATDRLQAEEHQRAFCEWVAGRLVHSGRFVVLRSMSVRCENHFPTVRASAAIKQIVRRTGHHRETIRRIIRGQRSDVFRPRQSSIEAHLPWLDAQWEAGLRNAAALWRQLRTLGFHGSARVVREWATRRRRADKADAKSLARTPSARTIARLMTTSRDDLSKSDSVTIAAIEEGTPALVEAREIVDNFHAMLRTKAAADLPTWIERASASLIGSFANGVRKDFAAVRAAITSMWSSGQTEGQITKLKLVKRQMYGRAKLDLLQARLVGAD